MAALKCCTAIILTIIVTACGGDPAGPESGPLELPASWTFDGGSLDGWALETRSGGTGGGTAAGNDAGGYVELTAWGESGTPDAWMSLQVNLPDVSGLWIDARAIAGCVEGAERDSAVRIRLTQADGTVSIIDGWYQVNAFTWPGDVFGGSLDQFAGETVTITIEQDDDGEPEESAGDAESVCVDNIDIFIH